MTTMDPLRCIGLKQAVLSDDGSAVLLELAMANGKIFPLELDAGGIALLTRSLLASAQAIDAPAAPATPPADASPIPADAADITEQADGSRTLRLVVGALTLHLSLPR